MRYREKGIEYRLTGPYDPWTNSQVEPMNRILQHATVTRYRYESHDQHREDRAGSGGLQRRQPTEDLARLHPA